MHNPYQILDIPEDASKEDIEKAYYQLCWRLLPDSFPEEGNARAQARKCLAAMEYAYQTLKDPARLADFKKDEAIRASQPAEVMHPRLGQLCIAAGIISMEQLDEAVQTQLESGLPLGEVLENKQFLSRAELEGLLLGQDLIDVDGEHNDPVAQRLIALNLATLDMVLIAQMEMKWQEVSLADIFMRHGWLAREVFEAIFNTPN